MIFRFGIWALATCGAAMIVTQSSIFRTLRERAPEGKLRTLLSCPMCSGFWFGVFWSLLLGSPTTEALAAQLTNAGQALIARFADGCVASILAEVSVTAWTTLARFGNASGEAEAAAIELKNALNVWRYYKSMPTPNPAASAQNKGQKQEEPPDASRDPGTKTPSGESDAISQGL